MQTDGQPAVLLLLDELVGAPVPDLDRAGTVLPGWDLPLESALAVERELQQLLFQSDDAKEGIAANQEKRVPKFKGK